MSLLNTWWPPLELTDEEREWCSYYQEGDIPGVLPRQWLVTLTASNVAALNVLSQNLQFSGRRIRIYAMTASGDIAAWAITLRSQAGELYIPNLAPVSTLLGLEHTEFAAQSMFDQSPAVAPAYLGSSPGGQPLLFDPNIVLEGTQGIVIDGVVSPRFGAAALPATDWLAVLNLCFWVWEFPDYPRERGLKPNVPNRAARRPADMVQKGARR